MLRRLRLKFILTNMLLVTVVLLAVFGALMISTAQQLERESAAAMKKKDIPKRPSPITIQGFSAIFRKAPTTPEETMSLSPP